MLSVHRSERADHLVESLGDLLLDALADPMAVEIVAVPSRGVERWLTQRLSHRLGARYARAHQAGPTRPHPLTPPRRSLLKSAGSAMALVDRTRDVLTRRGR